MKSLIITEDALQALAIIPLSPDWFIAPKEIESSSISVRESNEGVYISTPRCTPLSRLLVIARASAGLFDGVPESERRGVFDRCMRLGMHGFNSAVTVNPRWMPYHGGNRVSIFAYGLGHKERIVAEKNVRGEGHVFIFGFGDDPKYYNLANAKPDYALYETATAGYLQLGETTSSQAVSIDGQIELPQLEQSSVSKGLSYSDWYPLRLTNDQRRFVDHPLNGPLRLRGAAGTGKTLAMVIKALKSKYDADLNGDNARILFVTHSWAMAEFVDRLIIGMDENPSSRSTVDVFPLLTLAEQRDYAAIGRQPLGVDSDEGKRKALIEISGVVDEFLKGDWVAYKSTCPADFIEQIEADKNSREHRLFCYDLLVEFGCVIAAQGILTHPADEEKYLRIRRQKWMMPLEAQSEKKAVFALWLAFMGVLRAKGLILTDQIISDYLNELSTFYWEAARENEGYDIVFVDETHLFNSQERLVFHNLLKNSEIAPVVVMALDPDQSPRETFTSVEVEGKESGQNIFERAKLPNSQKIDLIDVFRYTPQIGKVVAVVRDAAPGLDPMDDWDIPAATSVAEAGPIPRVVIVENALQVFKTAMTKGLELNKAARSHDGRLAILCMDSLRFERFKTAARGQFKNDAFVVASRDDIEGLRYAGKKIVVSTPEYVAGLQFDTVILVDVNKDQVPEGKYFSFHLRRFVSELYLGISRAQRDLIVVASKDEGGLSPIVEKAVTAGFMDLVSTVS